MELRSGQISFIQLHEVVLAALDAKHISYNKDHLIEIGKWYYNFLCSNQSTLSLRLPFFDGLIKSSSSLYLYYFDLLIKILNRPPVDSFEDTALFDIFLFNQPNVNSNENFIIKYTKSIDKIVLYGKDTVVSKTNFFPVFETIQLQNLSPSDRSAIADSFFLVSEIVKKRLISYPIKLDLHETLTVFVSRSPIFESKHVLMQSLTCSGYSLSELDAILTRFESHSVSNSIFMKMPYNSNIEQILYNEFAPKTKCFEISFNKRFCYNEIKDNEIVLIPDENNGINDLKILKLLDCFEIIETTHSKDLYININELKNTWDLASFNAYRTPFPIKWLMYIHAGESCSFWIDSYKSAFPEVKGALLDQVTSLISAIYEINWSHAFFSSQRNNTILLNTFGPISEIVSSFKQNLISEYNIRSYETSEGSFSGQELLVLDPLNIASLVNLNELAQSTNLRIMIPDFILFGYIPYLKYYTARFVFTALLGGARSKVDENYPSLKALWHTKKTEIIDSCEKGLNGYLNKKGIDLRGKALEETLDPITPNIEFTESEIIAILNDKEQYTGLRISTDIAITTMTNVEYKFKPNSNILLQEKGLVLNSKASVLERGAKFLPSSELLKMIDRSLLSEKMSAIPDKAKRWRQSLTKKLNDLIDTYELLREQGLSIEKSTFYNDYVLRDATHEVDELSLPRARRDWEIICKYLNIPESTEAWRNHKCKADLNKLKKAYSEIIALLMETSSCGINTDEEILNKIADLFLSITDYKMEEFEEFDKLKEAKAIVSSISKHFDLLEVKTIEILNV